MVKITSCLLLNAFVISIMIITHTEYISLSRGKMTKQERKSSLLTGKFCAYKSPLASGHDKIIAERTEDILSTSFPLIQDTTFYSLRINKKKTKKPNKTIKC